MKIIVLLSLLATLTACTSKPIPPVSPANVCRKATAQEAPKLLWSNSEFMTPESIAYDETENVLYVSNINGGPLEKDQNGWISKVSTNGKMLKSKWFDGRNAVVASIASPLNAPKGIKVSKGFLWIADIDHVVAVEIKNARKIASVQIPKSIFLNDVATSVEGAQIFVSDMLTNKIYSLNRSATYQVYVDSSGLNSPNGLAVNENEILIAAWGKNIKPDFSTEQPGQVLSLDLKTKKLKPWSEKYLGHLDGIEMESPQSVLVSDWMAGQVYRLNKDGSCVTLLSGLKGTADLTYNPKTKTLYLPLMEENRIVAYKIP